MNNKNPFVVSCEIASLLIEKKLAHALTLGEKRQLFVHKLICMACRNYEKQSMLLDMILRNRIGKDKGTYIVEKPANSLLGKIKLKIISSLDKK